MPVPEAPPLAATVVNTSLFPPSLTLPSTTTDLVERLTLIVSDYLLTTSPNDQFKHSGREVLSAQIKWHVKQNVPLELVLPGFPFKSPSAKKVLGVLPDFGEEIVLRRLEDLCRALEDVYSPGAHLKIVLDGIIFNQLLGVTDSTAFQYNAELRRMVTSFRLRHISFVRVQDLLSSKSGDLNDSSEPEYLANAPITREEFLSTKTGDYNAEARIESDEGALRMAKSLELDLEGREAQVLKSSEHEGSQTTLEQLREVIAKRMIGNGAKLSALVEKGFPHAVRLSIQVHTNAGPKFTLRLFPGIDAARSPWHNAVVLKLDGSIAVQQSHTVDENTHERVYKQGRPYYWREIDPAMQWGNGMEVTFDRMLPFGLLIRPAPGTTISWGDVPMDKVRALVSRYSLVLARGFGPLEEEEYCQKAREMGTIQKWVYGNILRVKDDPDFDMNNTTTCEAMPIHFDGVFKFKTEEDGSVSSDAPQFQMFQCRHAPTASDDAAETGGRTLFANTGMIYQQVLENDVSPYAAEVKAGKWTCFTPSNASFGGKPLEMPLIAKNPVSGRSVIRWHEHWPQDITAYKPIEAYVVATDPDLSEKLGNHVTELTYDRRFVYEHRWQTGDYLLADNYELMHTRTAFNPCNRELWRIHID